MIQENIFKSTRSSLCSSTVPGPKALLSVQSLQDSNNEMLNISHFQSFVMQVYPESHRVLFELCTLLYCSLVCKFLKEGLSFTIFLQLSSFQHCGHFRLLVFTTREVLQFLVRVRKMPTSSMKKRDTLQKKTIFTRTRIWQTWNRQVVNLSKSLAKVRLL